MEILATNEFVGQFWFEYILMCILTFGFFGMTVLCINILCKQFAWGGVIVAILFLAMALTFAFMGNNRYEEGIEIEHKVLITDYNEVYDKGYEVVEQEGDIFTIKKKDK